MAKHPKPLNCCKRCNFYFNVLPTEDKHIECGKCGMVCTPSLLAPQDPGNPQPWERTVERFAIRWHEARKIPIIDLILIQYLHCLDGQFGWFRCTDEDLMEQFAGVLTLTNLKKSLKRLEENDAIETQRKGMPARRFIRMLY